MKLLLTLALILFSYNSFSRDYLLEAMRASWDYDPEAELELEPDYVEEVDSYSNGSDSWDNLYLDPYENTEIIYDTSAGCD